MREFELRIEKIKDEIKDLKVADWSEIAYLEDKYELKEKHILLIDLIKIVDSICRANNIKYSIAYGTLMGAMRHGNFIPWDDDADVMMTREEFTKFQNAVKDNEEVLLFKILFTDRFTTKELLEAGIFIDIFVFDYEPEKKIDRKIITFTSKLYRLSIFNFDSMKKKIGKKNGIHKLFFVVAYLICICGGGIVKLLFKNKLITLHEKMILKPRRVNKNYMVSLTGTWEDLSRSYCASWFESYTEIELCGEIFMAISNSVDFCINRYGDYISLPSVEARKPEHEIGIAERSKWQVQF